MSHAVCIYVPDLCGGCAIACQAGRSLPLNACQGSHTPASRLNTFVLVWWPGRAPPSIADLKLLTFSPDAALVAGSIRDELHVRSLPTFATVMVNCFGHGGGFHNMGGIQGFQWSRNSRSIVVLLYGHMQGALHRTLLCLDFCLATQEQASTLSLDGGEASLSAFAEHVAFLSQVVVPALQNPNFPMPFPGQRVSNYVVVTRTRSSTELLRINAKHVGSAGLQTQFRWHPSNADLLAVLAPQSAPQSSDITVYSVRQGGPLMSHQLPFSDCKLYHYDWPANHAIVHGRNLAGQETVLLVGRSAFVLFSAPSAEIHQARAFSPDGFYIAVCSHELDQAVHTTKLEVYEVRRGKLCFSKPAKDFVQPGNQLGWRATWARNSQFVCFTLVTRGHSPLPASERMKQHLTAQGIFIVSVSRWQGLHPAVPVSACKATLQCLADSSKISHRCSCALGPQLAGPSTLWSALMTELSTDQERTRTYPTYPYLC